MGPIGKAFETDALLCGRDLMRRLQPAFAGGPANEAGEGDELATYGMLGRLSVTHHGIIYSLRRPG
jgi:hypothetical protein